MNVIDKINYRSKKYSAFVDFWNTFIPVYGEGFLIPGSLEKSGLVAERQQFSVAVDEAFFGNRNDTAIFIYAVSALGILLKREYGSKHITFHSPLFLLGAKEEIPAAQVPLFLDISETISFRDFVLTVQDTVQKCYRYQQYPLELLGNGSPVRPFQSNILVAFDTLHGELPPGETYDFVLQISRANGQLHFRFNLSAGIQLPFGHSNITGYFLHILKYWQQSSVPVNDIQILSSSEEQQILHGFNSPESIAADQTVISRFENQVLLSPEAPALVYDGVVLSYRELNERCNRLAHHLIQQYGAGREQITGLMAERSLYQVIGMLAILKTGGAYVPVDPLYPRDRKKSMLEESGVKLLLTDSSQLLDLDYYSGAVFALDIEEGQLEYSKENPSVEIAAKDLAYVIYTSGSTGRPKGIQITHGSLDNYTGWALEYYTGDGRCRHSALFTSLSFDFTLTGILCPLLSGGSVKVYNSSAGMDEILQDMFNENTVTDLVKLTPSHITILGQLGIKGTNVKRVVVGGEELTLRQVSVLRSISEEMEIINEYGPTEATVGCIIKKIEQEEDTVLIGRPVSNMCAYIMDEEGNLCGIGVKGEIWLGGRGLSRGYLNEPELTAARFVKSRYVEGLLYKSGDVGKWRSDGNMEYLGRKDDQVKIRGYRVEPGEIENRLVQHPGITQAAVLQKKNNAGTTQLTAYIAAPESITPAQIKEYLQQLLPDYMIPASFVILELLPLTTNGKIDKKLLRTYPDAATEEALYIPASGEIEEQLVTIWQNVLGRERIGVTDNFFEIGGDSLRTIMIFHQINKLYPGLKISKLFSYPTVSQQASFIRSTATSSASPDDEKMQEIEF
jgi:amino acid adenylation domain-containing protein